MRRLWLLTLILYASPIRADETPPFGFRRVAVGATGASFSPQGDRLAVGRLPAGKGIDLVALSGGARTTLVDHGKQPVWSPDGRFIAYVGPPPTDSVDDETIWLVEPTGANARLLVKGSHPQWSADGKRLYYNTRPDWHVWSIAVDEKKPQPRLLYGRGPVHRPALSPSCEQLVYAEQDQLHFINTGTGDVVRYVRTPAGALDPSWSPDGQAIAYGGADGRRPGVWISVLDGSTHLVAQGPYQAPVWSRDSRLLAFELRLGDAQDVFVTDEVSQHLRGPAARVKIGPGWTNRTVTLPELGRADLDHRVWRLSDVQGHLVFINIWATWCAPCREELPLVQALYERSKGRSDFTVLTLNVDQDPTKARRYASAMGLTIPIILASDYVRRQRADDTIPRNWIVGPGGTLLAERVGFNVRERNGWVDEVIKELEQRRPRP
jgi:thiol-disulfide isomerase/thioredoxin